MADKKLTIGVAYGRRYENYANWIAGAPEAPEIVPLSPKDNNVSDVDKCDGILLTGGEDIHPRRYAGPEFYEKLDLRDVDEQRDGFEWALIDRAFAAKKNILGICRGLQVMNVYLGGSLIFDLPNAKVHREPGRDLRHHVSVKSGSLLHRVSGVLSGEVNSAHHQAADRIASELVPTAWAEPTVVEALEWKETAGKPWMLLVEWHPERMEDQGNPLAGRLRAAFLDSIVKRTA